MKSTLILIFSYLLVFQSLTFGQLPHPALVGYLHNWNYSKAPYIEPLLTDPRYNVIEIAFATPESGTNYKMRFTPARLSKQEFIRQIQTLQSAGRKVLISIGGGGTTVRLNTAAERDIFINSMNGIINTYGFDGIDLDLESSSVTVSGGSIKNPVDSAIIYMIDAIKKIMSDYRQRFNKKLILTMAPETAYVQGGQSAYGGVWGAYLPIIDALRDSIDILQTQLYNSGSMYGIDGNIYLSETADFIVAMCEAVIQGFNTRGGYFDGLPASKIAAGLPACPDAAGSGYTLPVHVRNAIGYLRGNGVQPGLYKLFKLNGYPDLAGMMTWSINWDAAAGCGGAYQYADVFEDIFGLTDVKQSETSASVYPNPATDYIEIQNVMLSGAKHPFLNVKVYDALGMCVLTHPLAPSREGESVRFDVSGLAAGVYFVRLGGRMYKFLKL